MPELVIRIRKNGDGSATLSCTRADGTVTWQRQPGTRGRFFPLHDLTHYAVESELGFGSGFFGLLAAGWELRDTEGRGARGPLPPEAVAVEHIVGLLDTERTSGVALTAAELNEQTALFAAARDLPPPRALTDAQLERVRAARSDLFARWRAIAPGGALELPFDRPALAT